MFSLLQVEEIPSAGSWLHLIHSSYCCPAWILLAHETLHWAIRHILKLWWSHDCIFSAPHACWIHCGFHAALLNSYCSLQGHPWCPGIPPWGLFEIVVPMFWRSTQLTSHTLLLGWQQCWSWDTDCASWGCNSLLGLYLGIDCSICRGLWVFCCGCILCSTGCSRSTSFSVFGSCTSIQSIGRLLLIQFKALVVYLWFVLRFCFDIFQSFCFTYLS